MCKETQSLVKSLIGSVRSSDEYARCAELRHRLRADAVISRLVDRYEQLQYSLQVAAVSQKEPDPEDVEEFRKLNLLLLDHEDASAYFMAKMKYDRLVHEVYEALSDGLDFQSLPAEKENP